MVEDVMHKRPTKIGQASLRTSRLRPEEVADRRKTYEVFLEQVRRLDARGEGLLEAMRLFPRASIYDRHVSPDIIAQCEFVLRLLRGRDGDM